MYRINRLGRNVLITADEVKYHAPCDSSVSERNIIQNIILAEERYITEAIGDDFYYDFIDKKNRMVTTSNQNDLLDKINESLESYGLRNIEKKELPIGILVNAIEFVDNEYYVQLWGNFLWKLTAECVDAMSTVTNWVKHTNQGQMLNAPKVIGTTAEANSADPKDIKFKMDHSVLDRINPFKQRMEEWICKRIQNYPLYNKECGKCNSQMDDYYRDKPTIKAQKSDIVLGVYN
ncbi:hypothetical protein ETU09_05725 [Apibacter muscae]|uniref:Uncharacterized protein n=1 Tax=Apibacter muscae TaxID=2509004 RepID=A0A563DE71_9FLAO|nr:hypothetical protein [Apibacter muscae]TWP28422.1 hypothetical protein ETU09_05725 [Apibacter muscae]